MSCSLLQALDGEEFDTAFFLTYTLNLRFFEGLVLPRLRRMGVTRIGILVDHTGYAETLRHLRQQERYDCGRAYIVAPVRLRGGGIQHAKAMWLSGTYHRVLVGSHNLTMSGFNDQIELTTELRSTIPEHVAALHDLGVAIGAVTPPPLQRTWTHIYESLPTAAIRDTHVHALTSLHEPLEDQLARAVGSAERLRVVTPFLDGDQLRRLVTRTGARDVVLDVPSAGLDISLADAMRQVPTLKARSVHDTTGRPLHAKGYEFRSGEVTWTAVGSANCTNATLAHSVAEGGNLEFLVVTRDVALPTDLKFEPVRDPAAFPFTGRTWNEGKVSSALMVTRAEYQNHQLCVEWETAGYREVALAELQVGDLPPYQLDASPAVLPMEGSPPDYVTLRGLVGEDVVEARAWIINHDDLAQAAQRAHVQRWAEQISSRAPLQLASGIDLWIALFLVHEIRHDLHTQPSAGEGGSAPQTVESGQRMRDFHEVFTYSTDETRLRRAAEKLLAGPKGADPLAIFRALVARISSTTEDDEPSQVATNADSQAVQSQYAEATREREMGHLRVVNALIRLLRTLVRESNTWATPHTSNAAEKIRLAASLITVIGYELVRKNEALASKRAQLVEVGLQWVQAIQGHPDVLSDLAVRGPLVLSLAVLGNIALLEGQTREHDNAATLARGILGADPLAVLDTWRVQYPDQADSLLTASTGCDLFQSLTRLAEQLLGIPPPYLRAQLHDRWGLLMALQEADIQRRPDADTLYAQAADIYNGSQVWNRYQARRVKRQFPVIVGARNGRCPRCGLQLSIADSRKLNRGEPILNVCQHVLLLGV